MAKTSETLQQYRDRQAAQSVSEFIAWADEYLPRMNAAIEKMRASNAKMKDALVERKRRRTVRSSR